MNIVDNGIYRHVKTGVLYTVLGTCRNEADNEIYILYQRANTDDIPWVRPKDSFKDRFERSDVNKT